ncbi:MAG: Peptidase family M28 [Candidatus Hydrogenedentes bacterium ADurb.Bin101]|nr:MAG: Peptidase family M28 [Candidatus Hydrogenedentes bacterium ADurb.Bin101]HOC69260.1 M20/M25/M40 family metallo-hydrolase [Candidatus Hydrogenedentota bacterium]
MSLSAKSSPLAMVPIAVACAGVCFALWMSLAPYPVPASAPPEQFSAERAHQHIAAVCTAPQPAGSVRNDEACAYIQKELERLDVETELIHVYDKTGERQVSRRRAVLGRIRGTHPTKAFAMDAHFDSVAWGPGASDDWSGIAAMLETARALKSSPPLQNDIIFVFADQEEFNMGGARAFRNHPWFQDVGVMLGLETRGTCGPSLMFETSPDNGFVLREMARAGVGPRTNSIMYDFYKRMPFNSDFEHYKFDVAGMNLAFVDGFDHYHTVLDNPENASLASLQHHGNYTLGLARHFGMMDLDNCHAPDAQYFNTIGGHLVVYPLSWGWPLAAAAMVFTLLVFAYGFISRKLSLRGVLTGILIIPLAGLIAAVPIGLISYIVFNRFRETALYQNNVFSLGMVAVGLSVFLFMLALFRRCARPQDLLAGALLWWLAGLAALQVWLPGGANLALIPLVSGGLYLLVVLVFTQNETPSPVVLGGSVLLALPPLLFITGPLAVPFYAVTVMASIVLVPLVILLTAFIAPQLHLISRTGLCVAGTALMIGGSLLLVAGYRGCLPGPDSPKLNCLAYGVDFDREEACWLSSTTRWDAWLARYIPEDAPSEPAGRFMHYDDTAYKKAAAPMPPLGRPTVEILEDTVTEGRRRLTCKIYSPRAPQRMWLRVTSDTPVYTARILGHELPGAEKDWDLSLEIPPREGVEVYLETAADKPLRIAAREKICGLPAFEDFVPRPAHMAPEPNRTLVRLPLGSDHTYSFCTVDLGLPPAQNQ